MSGNDGRVPAHLAFWAKNMAMVRAGGMEWPGFSYGEAEWRRMDALAATVDDGAYHRYVLVNAVIFIGIAALGIVTIFLPLATVLFPVPAETPALGFSLLLAVSCLLIIGLGLPLSLALAARLCATARTRAIAALPGDAALASRVRWQIGRITLVMCGLLVPGMLLFITYDIDAGPIVTALKWLAVLALAIAVAACGVIGAVARRKVR